MGHSEGINRDVYQCPLALKEITEVGSFLNTLDKGASQMAPSSSSSAIHGHVIIEL